MAITKSGPCGLCGAVGRLTREDAYPNWLRDVMSARHIGPTTAKPPRVILWVCVDCNHAMSRLFENPAAPIIKPLVWGGQRSDFTVEETRTLARWIIKTCALLVLYRLQERAPHHYLVSEERGQMLREVVLALIADPAYVPANAIIRLGRTDPNAEPSPQLYVPRGARNAVGSRWLANFHPIGLFVTQLWLFTDDGGDADRYRFITRRDPHMVLLGDGPTAWPPRESFRFEGTEEMRRQLGHVRDTVGGGWQVHRFSVHPNGG